MNSRDKGLNQLVILHSQLLACLISSHMGFGDSLHKIEKNNSKIVSLEKIENVSNFRGFSREYREYREVALITASKITCLEFQCAYFGPDVEQPTRRLR